MESDFGTAFQPAVPSQLDTKETSARPQLPADYQSFRRQPIETEWNEAGKLYAVVDQERSTSYVEKFIACRKFAWFVRHETTGEVRIASNACRLRWCPICSRSKFMATRSSVADYVASLRSPKFLTLTLRHSRGELLPQVQRLYKQFRLFRQHKGISRKIRGGIWFFQCHLSPKTQEWHPHLHCLIDADYISKRFLSMEWERVTGNSFIIDIRKVKNAMEVTDYVSRYCSRPAGLVGVPVESSYEMFSCFHGRRLCGVWGSARGVSLTLPKLIDPGLWKNVGPYNVVITNAEHITAFKACLKAWLTKTPMPRQLLSDLPGWEKPSFVPPQMKQLSFETLYLHSLESG